MSLENPNRSAITVTTLSITLRAASLPLGCPATDFLLTQARLPSGGVPVPASGASALSPAQLPTIRMLETGANQDACENAHLTLELVGSAHS